MIKAFLISCGTLIISVASVIITGIGTGIKLIISGLNAIINKEKE